MSIADVVDAPSENSELVQAKRFSRGNVRAVVRFLLRR
jgi:hypothetical protein